MFQVIKESAILFATFGIGLYTFRHLNFSYRLLFFQTLLAVISFFIAHAITISQEFNHLPRNNQWMYNIYILVEATLLIGAGMTYFTIFKERFVIFASFIIFLLVLLFEILRYGFWRFANMALIVEGIILVPVYLFILYRRINMPSFSWKSSSELWLCLGISLYFGCNVPFMGMIHYLYEHYPLLTEQLFHFITDILGNVRYLFLGISFWLFFRQRTLLIET